MRTTKSEILAHLKRTGGSPIEELATSLGLARMTVRQHLAMLERDALVSSREGRRGAGGAPHGCRRGDSGGAAPAPRRPSRELTSASRSSVARCCRTVMRASPRLVASSSTELPPLRLR